MMVRTTDSPTSRRSARGSDRGGIEAREANGAAVDDTPDDALDDQDEQDDDEMDEEELNTGELVAAALLGAVVGAGLGLLASRYVDTDDLRSRLSTAGRQVNRGMRRGLKKARRGAALPDVRDFAHRAREAFEDALEREVRALRRVAGRRRRRFGF